MKDRKLENLIKEIESFVDAIDPETCAGEWMIPVSYTHLQEEEMRKLQQRNSRPKAAKPQPKPIQELSLFQGMELWKQDVYKRQR